MDRNSSMADDSASEPHESLLPPGVFDTSGMTPPLAPFVSKLAEILDTATKDDGIRWGSAGCVRKALDRPTRVACRLAVC